MGVQINLNKRLTEDEKSYLRTRGRGYLIPANERRFGTEAEPREPGLHEQENSHALSPFYQPEVRLAAVYEVGGAPLPDTTLDYNTGRVADRDNGQLVEFTGPGHTPGAFDLRGVRGEPEGFASYSDDDDDIDEDIVNEVLSISSVVKLKARLKEEGVDFDTSDKRDELENKLAVALQDKRDNQQADSQE